MPKIYKKVPRLFVACPYLPVERYDDIKFCFQTMYPGPVKFGDDRIQSDHILNIVSRDIKNCGIFVADISDWNPNVTLELGIAKGLGKSTVILRQSNSKNGVPSDIAGMQRIEFKYSKNSHIHHLHDQLYEKLYYPSFLLVRQVADRMPKNDTGGQMTDLSLATMRHMSLHKTITVSEIKALWPARRLQLSKVRDLAEVLVDVGVLKRGGESDSYQRGQSVSVTV